MGRSGRVTEVNPRPALRRISAAASSGSAKYVIPSGMIRSGCGRVPLLEDPVVPRLDAGQSEFPVLAEKKTRPQKPVICEGKFTEAHTPLTSMSRTRASTS